MTKGKTALTEVNEVVKEQTKSKVRNSLQTVKESTNEQTVTGKKMVYAEEKNLPTNVKKSRAVERIIAAEKENAPVVRRSKRKTAVTENVTFSEGPMTSKSIAKSSKSKAKKPASKSKKSKSTIKSVAEQTDLNQTKLNFSPIPVIPETNVPENVNDTVESEKGKLATSFSSVVTEDSGYAHSAGTSTECISQSIAVFNSPDIRSYPVTPIISENSILTIESPPISYWKDLAEQRRVALDKTLHENELLHDQLAVLEAENSQLKQLVKEAEELAQVLKSIIQ